MTTNKRKKSSRLHGSTSHGYGAMKKHRGAGSRGGKGMAGTGKRGDVKKPSIWKNKQYFGKFGFKKKNTVNINAVNLKYLEERAENLAAKKIIEKSGDTYIIDIQKLGFNKVLSKGKITKKFKITSPSFSAGAIEVIKAAGGEAIQAKKEATPASANSNESKKDTKPSQTKKSEKGAAEKSAPTKDKKAEEQ